MVLPSPWERELWGSHTAYSRGPRETASSSLCAALWHLGGDGPFPHSGPASPEATCSLKAGGLAFLALHDLSSECFFFFFKLALYSHILKPTTWGMSCFYSLSLNNAVRCCFWLLSPGKALPMSRSKRPEARHGHSSANCTGLTKEASDRIYPEFVSSAISVKGYYPVL